MKKIYNSDNINQCFFHWKIHFLWIEILFLILNLVQVSFLFFSSCLFHFFFKRNKYLSFWYAWFFIQILLIDLIHHFIFIFIFLPTCFYTSEIISLYILIFLLFLEPGTWCNMVSAGVLDRMLLKTSHPILSIQLDKLSLANFHFEFCVFPWNKYYAFLFLPHASLQKGTGIR